MQRCDGKSTRTVAQVFLLCSLVTSVAFGQQVDSRAHQIRTSAIGQLIADLTAAGAPAVLIQRLGSPEITIAMTPVSSGCRSVELFGVRVQQSLDGHPVLVAIVNGRTFMLGGFAAPELMAMSAALDSSARVSCADRGELVRLLDPHGGIEILNSQSPAQVGLPSIVRWQLRRAEEGWPTDTTLVLPGGGRVERVTVFSRSAGAAPQWTPVMYVFTYDKLGQLVAWSRTIGESIGP
jgi:hypothetical protein